jgi:hypothetical protein
MAFTYKAPIYAFYHPDPTVEVVDGRECEVFKCAASPCKYPSRYVRRFQDTKDAKSTGNLRKHALRCWSEEALAQAYKAASADDVRKSGILASGQLSEAIDVHFTRTGKGQVTYSHRQHTATEARSVQLHCLRLSTAHQLSQRCHCRVGCRKPAAYHNR